MGTCLNRTGELSLVAMAESTVMESCALLKNTDSSIA
jgi:hypothetical protein